MQDNKKMVSNRQLKQRKMVCGKQLKENSIPIYKKVSSLFCNQTLPLQLGLLQLEAYPFTM